MTHTREQLPTRDRVQLYGGKSHDKQERDTHVCVYVTRHLQIGTSRVSTDRVETIVTQCSEPVTDSRKTAVLAWNTC